MSEFKCIKCGCVRVVALYCDDGKGNFGFVDCCGHCDEPVDENKNESTGDKMNLIEADKSGKWWKRENWEEYFIVSGDEIISESRVKSKYFSIENSLATDYILKEGPPKQKKMVKMYRPMEEMSDVLGTKRLRSISDCLFLMKEDFIGHQHVGHWEVIYVEVE